MIITKFEDFGEMIFESLPRQSTVDQLKRIRSLIKKNGGDVGDRVAKDYKKHRIANLGWYDNPTDRHIDSYEEFARTDNKKGLGYTKMGDPKIHKGTDAL